MFNLGELFVAFTGKDMGLDSMMTKANRQSVAMQGTYLRLMGAGASLGTAGQVAFGKIAVAAQVAWASVTMGLTVLLALGGALIGLGGYATATAGSFNEVKSKFDTVYKESAPKVTKELDNMAAAMGRSKSQMYGMAAGTQDLLVPLGFARDKAAGMSIRIAQLAVDMASFNNVSDADAMNDIQAAMTGSGEVMKKYGIVLSENTLKAELLSMGISGGAEAATEQQKALARLNIIVKGSSDAHGDAVRTGGSFANQIKRIMGIVSDLSIKIGNIFVPATEVFLDFFGDGMQYIDQNTGFIETWGATLKGWAEFVVGAMRRVIIIFMSWGQIAPMIGAVATGMMVDLGNSWGTILGNIWQAMLSFGENWLMFWPNLFESVAKHHGSLWGFMKKGWSEIWAFIKSGGRDAIEMDFDKIVLDFAGKLKTPDFKPIQAPRTLAAWNELVSTIESKISEADRKAGELPDITAFDKSLAGGEGGKGKTFKFEMIGASELFSKNLKDAFGDKEGEKLEIMKKQAGAAEVGANAAKATVEELKGVRAVLDKTKPVIAA